MRLGLGDPSCHMSKNPDVKVQSYVDDPLFSFDCTDPFYKRRLGISLLWAAVAGFPLKLEKSDAGTEVKCIGAQIKADHEKKTVIVTLSVQVLAKLGLC